LQLSGFADDVRNVCGVNVEMARQTFGQALGELILQRRRALGLTQTQLAEDAYGTSTKTRRISELESGLVANPHLKTIDPIIVALKIPQAEIEECAKRAKKQPNDELDRAYREARNLIEAISRQFEHSKPNASLAELDDFLRGKAAEWASLRERIAGIDGQEAALTKLKNDANVALAEGQFDKVDELLAHAEECYQSDRTLAEIRKHAAIRVARGDNSLLSGQPEAALTHYKSAAEFFRPFDEKEMADILEDTAHRIYEVAKRSLRPAFHLSAELLESILELAHVKSDARLYAGVNYRLGLAIRNHYISSPQSAGIKSLDRAIAYSRKAASYSGGEGESFQTGSMKISLANLLLDRAKLEKKSDAADITEAISLLQKLRIELRDDEISQELRSYTCNSLGAALLSSRDLNAAIDKNEALSQALDAFRETVEISELYSDAENWGAAKANIGGALAEMANRHDLEVPQRNFLRIRAISEFGSAIETTSIVSYPLRAAALHEMLAQVLVDHAVALNDEFGEVYLARAIHSYEISGSVFTRELHPLKWARLQERIGSIFAHHSRMPNVTSVNDDTAKAIMHLEEAASVFKEIGTKTELKSAQKKIALLRR
jgi:transcriptional regulator with XRE-family HTH domain